MTKEGQWTSPREKGLITRMEDILYLIPFLPLSEGAFIGLAYGEVIGGHI